MQTDIVKSILSSNYIKNIIVNSYNIGIVKNVFLIKSGLNDIYMVNSNDSQFVFKIYHKSKKNSAIEFENEYMLFLKQYNLSTYPIKNNLNKYIISVKYPEGIKFAILMKYIPYNDFLYYKNNNEAYLYGKYLAKLHKISKQFSSLCNKKVDIKQLLSKSSIIIINFLSKIQSSYLNFFKHFINLIQNNLKIDDLKIGYIHGDTHGGNAKYYKDKVTFFDFEFSGYGYYLYDIATFKWGCLIGKRKNDFSKFLKGYLEILSIDNYNKSLLYQFVAIRHLFVISLDIYRFNILGYEIIGKSYINKRVKLLQYINEKISKRS